MRCRSRAGYVRGLTAVVATLDRVALSLFSLPEGLPADLGPRPRRPRPAAHRARDGGKGMSPESRSWIFDPFFDTQPRDEDGGSASAVHGLTDDPQIRPILWSGDADEGIGCVSSGSSQPSKK